MTTIPVTPKLKGQSGLRCVAWFPRLNQGFDWLAEHGLREADLQGAEAAIHALCTLQHAPVDAVESASKEDIALREMDRIGCQRPDGDYTSNPATSEVSE